MLMGCTEPQYSLCPSLLLQSAVMFSVVHAIVLVLMMCAEPRGVSSFKLWGHSLAVLAFSLLGLVMGAR